ncbi:PREDICTED: FHA domain-containing protein DDL-like isoform X2 [Nelumbo nucifera]|uniref:FHA domain-containing protein DDL-like isoform X2 n=1 Tax=Nelumbo nucifera TaxID=4432 RepID=A0A1U8B8P1_NELNU|nr:PREDICTED: FHA domain-containing protein DDL-like isoform X2 [Nelumbo nucifera]
MSPAVNRRSPSRRGSSERSESPVRGRGSPRRRSPSRRERSPARQRSSPKTRSPVGRTNSSHKARSPAREKLSSRDRSPKNARSTSPVSGSPSPRTKRLRREQAQREEERVSERERERNGSSRDSDNVRHKDRSVDREVPSGRSERRSTRDKVNGGGSSRSKRERSTSPSDRGRRNRHSSRSPPRAKTEARHEVTNSREDEQYRDSENDSIAKMKAAEEALETKQKQKPSFELSGKLAAETNRVRGVTMLFNEPPDARKPDIRWRLYVFKAGEVLNEPLYIHRQSCYLFGRERRVADIPTDHPSCSKQHAVVQFRQVEKEQPDGRLLKQPRVCNVARELSGVMSMDMACGALELIHCDCALWHTKDPGMFHLHNCRFCLLQGIHNPIQLFQAFRFWLLNSGSNFRLCRFIPFMVEAPETTRIFCKMLNFMNQIALAVAILEQVLFYLLLPSRMQVDNLTRFNHLKAII